jgi:hypothetical protein
MPRWYPKKALAKKIRSDGETTLESKLHCQSGSGELTNQPHDLQDALSRVLPSPTPRLYRASPHSADVRVPASIFL